MDWTARARAYLETDWVFYADMLESLRRGTAELLYAAEDGVLLYETLGEVYMMSVRTPEAAARCFGRMTDCRLLVGHELWYKEEAAARYSLTEEEMICYQAAWPGGIAPPEPGISLRRLEPDMAGWAYDHYSHRFCEVDYIEDAIARGMLGAFVEGHPAGFVGTHPEGSIGLLEVLPAYRRRGVGKALLHGAVRQALVQGAIPYGQVEEGNAPSLALQRKAGMAVSEKRLFWLS